MDRDLKLTVNITLRYWRMGISNLLGLTSIDHGDDWSLGVYVL
jgi:hypothetical protein